MQVFLEIYGGFCAGCGMLLFPKGYYSRMCACKLHHGQMYSTVFVMADVIVIQTVTYRADVIVTPNLNYGTPLFFGLRMCKYRIFDHTYIVNTNSLKTTLKS